MSANDLDLSDNDRNELATALAALTPQVHIDRDALLLAMGRASARSGRVWPILTLFSTLIATGLAVRLATLPEPTVRIEVVREMVPAPGNPQPTLPSSPSPAVQPEIERPYLTANAPELPLISPMAELEQNLAREGFDAIPLPRQPSPGQPVGPYPPLSSWYDLRRSMN